MEALTRFVAESLARHGFDRPLDYRRLHWSRWFRCESHHSLLSVPSKSGVFALAEELGEFGKAHAWTGASPVQAARSSAENQERHEGSYPGAALAAAQTRPPEEARRMLAVTQFYEADDMAFMLDRMLSYQNPMRARLASGRYFLRFVVIDDASQRRSICSALNTWMTSPADKAADIGLHFANSLELTPEQNETGVPHACPEPSRRVSPVLRDVGIATGRSEYAASTTAAALKSPSAAPHLDSGAASNIHCPPFPSGF